MLFLSFLKQMEKESKEIDKEVEREVDELLVRMEEGKKRKKIDGKEESKVGNIERNDASSEKDGKHRKTSQKKESKVFDHEKKNASSPTDKNGKVLVIIEKEKHEERNEEGKGKVVCIERKSPIAIPELCEGDMALVMVDDGNNSRTNGKEESNVVTGGKKHARSEAYLKTGDNSDEEEDIVHETVRELDPKRVKGGYTVEVQTYRNANEPQDGFLKQLVEQLVTEGSAVFNDDIVPFEMKQSNYLISTKGGLGNAAVKWGLELEGVTLPSKDIMFNPLIGQMLGEVFSKMRIESINSLNDWLVTCNDDHQGNKKPCSSPGNMMVSFVPMKAGLPSPYYNRYNDEEFIRDGNTVHYNDSFWRNQMDFKNLPNGNLLCILDCAGFIPEFVLKQNSIQEHREALKWFHDYGCGVGGSGPFFKCSFFGPYVHVLESFLTSAIVKVARIYGFWPLFLVKNFLLQQTKFGVKGMQFSSVNMNARTSVMLIGFWRMKHNNQKKLEFISVTGNGSLLTQYQEGV